MTEEANAIMTTYPFDPPANYDGPMPRHVIVREITFAPRENELKFYFSRGIDIDLDSYPDSFEEIVDKVCNRSFAFPPRPLKLVSPFKSPLSLSNNRFSYVVYVLSENKNWQFSRRGWPITITKLPIGRYYNGRRADKSGHAKADPGDFLNNRDDCNVAFFIADGRNPAPDGDNINLHIDLTFRDVGETPYFMPLIVDPDIRWPGGSQP